MSTAEVQFGAEQTNVDFGNSAITKASRQMANTQSKGQANVREAQLIGEVARGGAQLATSIINTQTAVDSNSAKEDYIKVVTSEGYVIATDTIKAEMLEEQISNLHTRSGAYEKAYLGYSAGAYASTQDGRQKELTTSLVNSAGASYTGYMETESSDIEVDQEGPRMTNRQKGKGAADFISDYVGAHPTLKDSKVELGQAVMAEEYTKMNMEVLGAKDEAGLTAALSNINDIKEGLKSPFLLNSTQAAAVAANTKREKALDTSIKAKQEEFKNQAYGRLAKAVESNYRVTPEEVEADIDKTASNPLAAEKQKQDYNKKYIERTVADEYRANNPIGSRTQSLPDGNSFAKKERQVEVTNTLSQHLVDGNYAEFARVGYNEKDLGKKTGEYLLNKINQSTDPKELGAIMSFIGNVNDTNQGPTALRQMFTDDEYARLSVLSSMSTVNPDKSLTELRDAIDKSKSATNIIKLDVGTEMEIAEKAVKLGRQGQNYLNVMKQYKQINPQLAKDNYEKVADDFFKTMNTDSSLGGALVDTSESMNAEALNQDDFNERLVTEVIKDGTDVKFTTNSKGETLAVVSSPLGETTITNVTPILNYSDNVTKSAAIRESNEEPTIIGDTSKAVTSFTRVLVDNAVDAAVNFYPVLGELAGNMGERLLYHMVDSMSPGEAEFFGLDQKEQRRAKAADKKSTKEYISKQETDLEEFDRLVKENK